MFSIYENVIVIFSVVRTAFFQTFCFSLYKMVDSEYVTYIYKSLKIGIGTLIKNPEMITFIPDYLKTKKICNMELRNCRLK